MEEAIVLTRNFKCHCVNATQIFCFPVLLIYLCCLEYWMVSRAAPMS